MTQERVVTRWLIFNGVGVLGLALQLALLAALIRLTHLHHLAATAIAVEAAVLHNFMWHQRWTWRDRPSPSWRITVARLYRFHLVNGSVSLAGNLALMTLLVDRGGLDPIPANIVAVLACSLINFAGSHAVVFRAAGRRVPLVTLMMFSAFVTVGAAEDDGARLQAGTLAAWQAYERQVDQRYSRDTSGAGFFAQDAFAATGSWRQAAASGGTPMLQLESAVPNGAEANVPDGRIHHWVGAIFVPGLTVDRVLSYLEAHAGREAGSYDDVIASRLLGRDGDRLRVFLKLRRTKVITATYNSEHTVEYRRINATRASGRSVATRIAELADAGTPGEREKAPGDDSGYLWKLNAYWRYEQTPQGVLIECESVSLSRNIPALLRPFVSGIVEGVARESLERTLVSLRRVLTQAS